MADTAINEDPEPMIRVLNHISEAGFDGIGGLLASMMQSQNHTIKRHLTTLVQSGSAEQFVGLALKRRRDLLPIDLMISKMEREAEAIRSDKASHIGAKGVTPEFTSAFTFQTLGLRFASLAPSLWLMLCTVGDVDVKTARDYLKGPSETWEDMELVDDEVQVEDDEIEEIEDGPMSDGLRPRKKQIKTKQKVMAVITAIAGLVFTRSRNCNAFQMMMGYYLFATRTGKRVIGVLNHLGICTSYDTVRRALQSNAEKVKAEIAERSKQHPIMLTYDNLTNKHHAATETLLNKSMMQCFTAAGVIFLHLTPSLARRLGKDIDHTVPEKQLPGESDESARARRRRPAAPKDNKPGLRADLLLHPNPDWASITAEDIINIGEDQKYLTRIAKALMCRVINKFFPDELKCSEDEAGIRPIAMPQLYKVPRGASDMHTMETLQVDESTIDGNIAVLESLVEDQLGMTIEELAEGRMIPVSGDQMTVSRIRSAQFLRIRDVKEHRLLWAKAQSGMLHTRMALIHAIYLSHPGRRDGRDPASLWKFVKLLGRTKVKDKCPNLNASHELLTQVCEGHVLAALIERTGVQDFEGLRAKISSGAWREAVESIAEDWLQLDFVDQLREDARMEAAMETVEEMPIAGETLKQTQTRIKKLKTDAEMRRRDVVFENALLLMLQGLAYIDYHDALRSGDSGRLEKSSDIVCTMFQGLTKLKNYRQLTLDFKACREKEWTPEMRELWLLNSVVNLKGINGKFLAVDEFNEWIVRAVKNVYNQSGTIQSTKFTCDIVSPNVIPLYHAVNAIMQSSGAPTYGYKHARVDDQRDVKMIVSHLMEQKVFTYTPGRDVATDKHLRAIPATDLYSSGADALSNGDVLDRYRAMKMAHRAGEPGGLEPEDASLVDVEGEPDGLLGTREPTWTFGEDGVDGEDSGDLSVWQ